MSEQVWNLGTALGNVALAARLLEVGDGAPDAVPADAAETMKLVDVSASLQAKALKRYMRLKSTIGAKLATALAEYDESRKRTQRLTDLMVSQS